MKKTSILKILPVVLTMGSSYAQTAAERLEQGVQLQTADGDLTAAIAEYKAVLKSAAKSNRLASEARFRLAECFQAQGNQERMNHHLKLLRENFPADDKWVLRSIKLAPVKNEFTAMPWKDGRIYHSIGVLPGGKEIGKFILAERRLQESPRETWESIAIRNMGSRSLSRSEFASKGYRSIGGRWYLEQMGDMSISYNEKGVARFVNTETGEEVGSYDHLSSASTQIPAFENESMIQIIRALNQEVGTKQKTFVLSALNGATPVPFDLEVTEHLDIETAAGVFPCAKVKTNLNQTFYISRSKDRHIVRLEMGRVKVDLQKIESWNILKSKTYRSEPLGFSYSVPGTMIQSREQSTEKAYFAKFWSSDFAGRDAHLGSKKLEEIPEAARKSPEAYAEHIHAKVTKKGIFDELKVVENSWEVLDVNGKKAAGVRLIGTESELVTHEYHVTIVDPSLPCVVSLYISYPKVDEDRAIARVKEILATFKWE